MQTEAGRLGRRRGRQGLEPLPGLDQEGLVVELVRPQFEQARPDLAGAVLEAALFQGLGQQGQGFAGDLPEAGEELLDAADGAVDVARRELGARDGAARASGPADRAALRQAVLETAEERRRGRRGDHIALCRIAAADARARTLDDIADSNLQEDPGTEYDRDNIAMLRVSTAWGQPFKNDGKPEEDDGFAT